MAEGEGLLDSMHNRSRMTIDPRIPTLSGRSTSCFHRPGRHDLHRAQSALRCSASRMEGELHPTKNRLRGVILRNWMLEGGWLPVASPTQILSCFLTHEIRYDINRGGKCRSFEHTVKKKLSVLFF